MRQAAHGAAARFANAGACAEFVAASENMKTTAPAAAATPATAQAKRALPRESPLSINSRIMSMSQDICAR